MIPLKTLDPRLLGGLLLVLLIAPAVAAHSDCRHLPDRKERSDCYERPNTSPKQAPPRARTRMDDAVDPLKLENDRLRRRLQRICKGC
jgi:hypothetical protein